MTSKEALRKLYFDNEDLNINITLNDYRICEIYNIIKDDLDKLEKIKEEYKISRKLIKNTNKHCGELILENSNLKKLIEIFKDILEIELWIAKDGSYYLIECGHYKQITKEEFEFIKGVFK